MLQDSPRNAVPSSPAGAKSPDDAAGIRLVGNPGRDVWWRGFYFDEESRLNLVRGSGCVMRNDALQSSKLDRDRLHFRILL
jgi:hypothetical protein